MASRTAMSGSRTSTSQQPWSLKQQKSVAARIHEALAPDGVLMLGVPDVVDFDAVSLRELAEGRISGAEYYRPPARVAELFEPADPDGPLFQLLWRKKVSAPRPHAC
jgi:hypothetical protein